MPVFQYEAMDQRSGEEVKDTIDAPSESEAQTLIREKGLLVTRIAEKGRRSKTGKAAELYRLPDGERSRRTAAGCRTAARTATACSSRATGSRAETCALPRHGARTKGDAIVALKALRAGVSSDAARRLRAGELPRQSLLDPERPRAHDRRGRREAGPWKRDEVDLGAAGVCGESHLFARGTGTRRALPRARVEDAPRGPQRARLCTPERAQALAGTPRAGAAGTDG